MTFLSKEIGFLWIRKPCRGKGKLDGKQANVQNIKLHHDSITESSANAGYAFTFGNYGVGVISRGSGGRNPPLLQCLIILGAQPP